MFILFLLFIVSSFLLLEPSSSPDQPELPAPRPPTAFSGPLSLSFLPAPTEEAGPAARRTNPSVLSLLCLPRVPPHAAVLQSRSVPAPPGRPIEGRLGRRRPAPPALSGCSAGGRAGPQHSPSGAAQRWFRVAAPGAQGAALLLAGCWAEAASEAGATGRPERRLSSAGARGAGPRTEEEAAPRLPGPGARPEGAVAGRSRPGVSPPLFLESPPRAPGRPLGVPSVTRTHLRGPQGAQVRGRVRGEGTSPGRQRGGGGAARRPRPHRSASRAR